MTENDGVSYVLNPATFNLCGRNNAMVSFWRISAFLNLSLCARDKVSGTLYYPSNHWSKFGTLDNQLGISEGTQNINPGMLNVKQTDYSTSSFYRVKVTGGENQIRIAGNSSPKLDSDNKISYNN